MTTRCALTTGTIIAAGRRVVKQNFDARRKPYGSEERVGREYEHEIADLRIEAEQELVAARRHDVLVCEREIEVRLDLAVRDLHDVEAIDDVEELLQCIDGVVPEILDVIAAVAVREREEDLVARDEPVDDTHVACDVLGDGPGVRRLLEGRRIEVLRHDECGEMQESLEGGREELDVVRVGGDLLLDVLDALGRDEHGTACRVRIRRLRPEAVAQRLLADAAREDVRQLFCGEQAGVEEPLGIFDAAHFLLALLRMFSTAFLI